MKYLINKIILQVMLCVGVFFCVIKESHCQTVFVARVHGTIQSANGDSLAGCYIRISQKGIAGILYYTNTNEKSSFSINLSIPGKDSVTVSFSHLGYANILRSFLPTQSELLQPMRIVLTQAPKLLEEVILAPRSWKRGDTTFFNVESFKEGEERKLKDIIVKLPGFKINDDGNLEYKRRAVEKILVNGEDIFADKTSLLLNNFPIHVLDNIQAIENQTDNKLMKGLVNEGKVFVNLSIKKEKLNTAFGDGEVGIGTSGKYLVNPVLFALYGKLKGAFIGNYNNIGNGVAYKQENELKDKPIQLSDQWMMQNSFLYSIPNFENRNYINNRQWDNRLKLNYIQSAKTSSELEFNYLEDKQRQAVNNRSILFNNDNSFIERFEEVSNNRSPKIILLKEKTMHSISDKKAIVVDFSAYLNQSSGAQRSVFTEDMLTDTTDNRLRNNGKAFTGNISFTNRISVKTGYTLFVKYAAITNSQQYKAVSAAWPLVYDLNNPALNILNIDLTDSGSHFETGIDVVHKTQSGNLSTSLRFESFTSTIRTNHFLNSAIEPNADTTIQFFTNMGNYRSSILSGTTSKRIKVLKWPFSVAIKYGFAYNNIHEPSQATMVITPVYGLKLSQRTKYGKEVDANFDISYSSDYPQQGKFAEIPLPTTYNSFRSGYITNRALKKLNINYGLGFGFGFHIVYMNLTFISDQSSFITSNAYKKFVQLSVDTFLSKPRNTYGLSLSYSIPSLFLRSRIDLDGGAFYNEVIFKQNQVLRNGSLLFQHWRLSVKRNWSKRYFIVMAGDYTGYNSKYPTDSGKLKPSSNVANLKISLEQRYTVTKKISAFLNLDSYHTNLFTIQKNQFFFAEAGCDFSFSKFPVMFSLRGQNLLNATQFNSITITPLVQSFNAININRRNLYVSIRYEL